MSRIKLMMVAVFAALALSAVAAGSASAGWLVNGTPLGAGHSAALASLANVHGALALLTTVAGTPPTTIKIECTGSVIHIKNGRIIDPDIAYADGVTFLNCGTVEPTPSKCKLTNNGSEQITTLPALALAKLATNALEGRITFKPETGKLFTEVPFIAEEGNCVFKGPQPVKGEVTVAAPTGRMSEVEQGITPLGSVENNALEIGTNKAFLDGGTALLLLASGAKWSFD